jgi:ATP-dependent Clp protease ATP-binding subunit ClpA
MEEVLREISSVVQSIARVEAEVIAVEAATREAKAAGDKEELAALRDKENKLRDKENKLRDKENKLRDKENTLLQGACASALWCHRLSRIRVISRAPSVAQSGASPRLQTSKRCWRTPACRLMSTRWIQSHAPLR